MASPILTLTTDFGLRDHYAGTMKGVILSGCPAAQIVDITHQIPPFSIHAGAYAISQAAPYFPPGTVHVIVVDPGVGSERRAILVEAHGHHFVAPDNGVLTLAVRNESKIRIHELTNAAFWRPAPSSTFHGRDIFAPAAAALASGRAQAPDLGPMLADMIRLPDLEPVAIDRGTFRGRVLSVDHFGNVITNFKIADFLDRLAPGFTLANGITAFSKTFSEAPENQPFVYAGSSGYLEIGINQGNAAAHLGVQIGEAVTLMLRE